jgi:EmrB/QacA subfamily drug resistance transporter
MAPVERSFRASLAAMIGICLVFMLTALNTSVVGTAMPRIVADLRGYDLYGWAASAFLMTNAVTIPVTGRLGDLYGRKPFVLAAVVLFTLSSAACGMAQTMPQLVFARGVQGFASGMLIGVVAACVPDLFPDRAQRVRWQVLLSSSFGVALAVGPALGGWVSEHLGWRYVFFVNLPVALTALPMVARYLPHTVHHDGGSRAIDWLGAVLLAAAVAALLFAAEAAQGHGLASAPSLALWAATGVTATLFFRHQYRTAAPIVPPAVLDDRAARRLMLLGVLTGLSMFLLVFYTPLLLQGSFAQSPNRAGIVMTPLLVCITVGSIVNGRILPRLERAERVLMWGQVALLVGCLLLTRLEASTPAPAMMAVLALCGLSLGFQLPNLTLQIIEVAGRRHFGVASALVQSTRMIGSMVGVGLASIAVDAVYARAIGAALARYRVSDDRLVRLLASPQLLIRDQDREAMLQAARSLGVDPAPLLDAARQGLASGTHAAFVLCALTAALCVAISLKLPQLDMRPKVVA